MTRSSTARRVAATATMLLLFVLLASPTPASAHLQARHPSARIACAGIDWRQGPESVERLIRCAAQAWPVPGGADKAVAVAICESHLDPSLRSDSGTYVGVFQHSLNYWAERARIYGFPDAPATNGRANVIVSIRMAHVDGWGPWSCA